ncbi:MAG: hypothetical protein ACKOPE_12150 [Novosphingobium sp.]
MRNLAGLKSITMGLAALALGVAGPGLAATAAKPAAKPVAKTANAAPKPAAALAKAKPQPARTAARTAANGRTVNARLSNGKTVTYNCSLAGNKTKQACKR